MSLYIFQNIYRYVELPHSITTKPKQLISTAVHLLMRLIATFHNNQPTTVYISCGTFTDV
jgi:hypothetical protein